MPSLAADPPEGAELWHYLQEILLAPHAADALRAMHSLAACLRCFLPELKGIDALVIRDYSHRFTVDEHTFVAIENLHKLTAIAFQLGPALRGAPRRAGAAGSALSRAPAARHRQGS